MSVSPPIHRHAGRLGNDRVGPRRGAAHPDHRAAAAAAVRRPAGDVGESRHQPVRPAHRRPGRHSPPARSASPSPPSWSAAASGPCCSAPRRCSAPPPGRRPWCRSVACSAAAVPSRRRCSTSPRTSAGRRWRSSSSPPRPSPCSATQWRWPFVLLAGAAATAMAVRPLGSVRLLRKVMVWLVLAASVFLFVQVLGRPAQPIPQDGVLGFWPGVDLAVAGVISFAPAGRRLQPAFPDPEGRLLGRFARLRARRGRATTPSACSPSPTSGPAT